MLRYKADIRPLGFNFAYVFLFVLAWSQTHLNAWTLAYIVGLSVLAFLGSVQTHNAIHCPIFHKRWLNKTYQVFLTLIFGHMTSSFVPGHNLSHHKYVESNRDVMRTSKARFKINAFNLLCFMFLTFPAVTKGDSAYMKMMRTKHPRWFRQLVFETVVLFSCHILFLALDWQKALLFWFIPHIYASWGIVGFNLLQHDGTNPQHPYNHSRNFTGKVVNWFTFNNGFHTIHHLHPGMHWSLTRDAHYNEVEGRNHPNLNQKSLALYLFKTYVLNRRLDYHGNPVQLPPKVKDETWVPDPKTTIHDLGAESLPDETIIHQMAA